VAWLIPIAAIKPIPILIAAIVNVPRKTFQSFIDGFVRSVVLNEYLCVPPAPERAVSP
jgi:hypothetical protein